MTPTDLVFAGLFVCYIALLPLLAAAADRAVMRARFRPLVLVPYRYPADVWPWTRTPRDRCVCGWPKCTRYRSGPHLRVPAAALAAGEVEVP